MKNIQIIDDAINCTYEVFSAPDSDFELIFPNENDVEFEDDLIERLGEIRVREILDRLWLNRINKKNAAGIQGTLFFGYFCEDKRPFYPTKKESEMIANPSKSN